MLLVLVPLALPEVLVVGCLLCLLCLLAPLLVVSLVVDVSYTARSTCFDIFTNKHCQRLLLPLWSLLPSLELPSSLLLPLELPSSLLLPLLLLLPLPLSSPLWSLLPAPLPASRATTTRHTGLIELASFYVLVH